MVAAATYLPDEGIATVDYQHLQVLLDSPTGVETAGETARALEQAGMLHGRVLDVRLRPIVRALRSKGPWLLLQSRARGRLTRTSMVPRDDGAALVTRVSDDQLYHLGWIDRAGLARHVARRLGLGTHIGAEGRIDPLELARWDDVRRPFESAHPTGWLDGVSRAELHELRWWASPAGREFTAFVVASLDGHLVEVEPRNEAAAAPVSSSSPSDDREAGEVPGVADTATNPQSTGFVVKSVDTRVLWLRLCQITRYDWRPMTGMPSDGE